MQWNNFLQAVIYLELHFFFLFINIDYMQQPTMHKEILKQKGTVASWYSSLFKASYMLHREALASHLRGPGSI